MASELRVAFWLALLVGLIVRITFLADKPFWRDEAGVAQLVDRPLSATVDEHRTAPVGFVALAKVTALLPGIPPEVSFRIVPLLAGVVSLPLLWALAGAAGGSPVVATCALWIGAGLLPLIHYSRELKPYSLDLLLATATPLWAIGVLRETRSGRRDLMPAALAAAPWITFGSLFPIVGTLVAAIGASLRWGRRAACSRILLASLAYGVSFAAAYWTTLRSQATDPPLLRFWNIDPTAIGRVPSPSDVLGGLYSYFVVSFPYLFSPVTKVGAALALLGAACWGRPWRGFLCAMGAFTALATVAAAVTGRYVLSERLLLYTAPLYILFAAAGLVMVCDRLAAFLGRPTGRRLSLAVVVGASLTSSLFSLLHHVGSYRDDRMSAYLRYDVLHDVEPLISRASELVGPDEPVLVNCRAEQAFRFYARGRLSRATVCDLYQQRGNEDLLVRQWLEGVDRRGWILQTKDDVRGRLVPLLRDAGFVIRDAAAARGTMLWELTRSHEPAARAADLP